MVGGEVRWCARAHAHAHTCAHTHARVWCRHHHVTTHFSLRFRPSRDDVAQTELLCPTPLRALAAGAFVDRDSAMAAAAAVADEGDDGLREQAVGFR